jgi:hypothetical protein
MAIRWTTLGTIFSTGIQEQEQYCNPGKQKQILIYLRLINNTMSIFEMGGINFDYLE